MAPGSSIVESGVELLERGEELATLADALAAAEGGEGRLVFVSGDAGMGKSALVREFCSRSAGGARVLIGPCDGLRTPRPLGPLIDIATTAGGRLEKVIAAAESVNSVFDALLEELRAGTQTDVIVLEDVHWADEATLDVLGLLGRRVEQLGALIIATYRSEELPRSDPFRVVLGDLATAVGVARLEIEPLSPDAVATLGAPYGVDGADLHRRTGGNPFFVTEVLASGGAEIPPTIRDAVLARAARLDGPARDLLDAVSIVPQRTELWLLEELAGESFETVEEGLASGMLSTTGHAVAFRHELARMAVEGSISPHRRIRLHRAAVQALRSPPAGTRPDLARLAHHAEAAGDAGAVLEFAPVAAERAAAVGAHREAAAQYARALRCADSLPPAERAELLERRSFECYLTDQQPEAIAALEEAIEHHRSSADLRREGVALDELSLRIWCTGDMTSAAAASAAAIEALEKAAAGPELARAYAGASSIAMNAEKAEPAFAWGRRAFDLIDAARDIDTLAYQLNNTGTMDLLSGQPEGRARLERSIALAAEAGLEEAVGRGYVHLAWVGVRTRDFGLLERLADGLDYCTEHGLELWRLYLMAYRARGELDQGRWTAAAESVSYVLRHPRHAMLLRLLALSVLGAVRARRGDPDAWTPLDEAFALVSDKSDLLLQHLAPVAVARTEAASLEGRPDLAAEASDRALELAVDRGSGWVTGELALWRRRAGIDEPCPEGAAEPFAVQLAGDWARATELWRRLGCPYEAALALGEADDIESLRRALDELDGLGAGPAADLVRRRLRERGERGPRRATRANPAGLTERENEVLELVAQGLKNRDIADRLVLSVRTVDHHVSAILSKLEVSSRAEASATALQLGLVDVGPRVTPQPGPPPQQS